MPVQMGILPLQGTIGNLNFYKSGDRFLARAKTGVTGDRIAIDPKFQRSRENSAEFATAAKGGKLVRTAFQTLIQPNYDTTLVRRLTTKMISVLQTDTVSARGMRTLMNGNLALLEGYEFHELASMSTTFVVRYSTDINRETGELSIFIPAFTPGERISAPAAATHFKLISGGAAIDFENKASATAVQESAELPLNNEETAEMVFINKVSANSPHPLFLVLGIEFYQRVNAWMYPLKEASFNALAIIKVAAV